MKYHEVLERAAKHYPLFKSERWEVWSLDQGERVARVCLRCGRVDVAPDDGHIHENVHEHTE